MLSSAFERRRRRHEGLRARCTGRARRRGLAACVVLALWSCGGGPRGRVDTAVRQGDVDAALAAYDGLQRTDGPDAGLLARVAEALLAREARSQDRVTRRGAVAELAMAGAAGRPLLERLAWAPGPPHVEALEALARRGDTHAERWLRGLVDDDDPEVRAAAVLGLDVRLDRALLLAAMTDPHPRARALAAERLGRAAPDSVARRALEDAARLDPDVGVRATAVRALGSFGREAVGALLDQLGAPEPSLRLAAVTALCQADRDAARGLVGTLLARPASSAAVEAARWLAATAPQATGHRDVDAEATLRQALASHDPALRAQAGVALASWPDAASFGPAVQEALSAETDDGVRLALARALLQTEAGRAHALEALRALARASQTMDGLQAAALLAAAGDAEAPGWIAPFLGRAEPSLRQAAARAIARDAGRPDEVRALLRDADVQVRLAAAGALLSSAGR